MAQRRLPPVDFDYLDGGADGEITLRENCRAFEGIIFRPRQAVSLGQCDLRTRILNFNLSFPAILAPVGYIRMMHPGGEVAAASAAWAASSDTIALAEWRVKALGPPQGGLHAFRRGCNRRGGLAGIKPAVIRQQMGRRSVRMTTLYSGENPQDQVRSAFSGKLLEKVENEAVA